MYKIIVLLGLPILAFASGDGNGETDILWRTINFFIFAGIAYYLFANKAKTFFVNRKNSIAERLNSIQQKLKESKDKKDEAIAKVEEAKATAKSLIITSDKENKLLLAKMASDLANEIENLKRAQQDQIDIETRKMTRQVVNEILEELFKSDAVSIDKSKFIDIIKSKVA